MHKQQKAPFISSERGAWYVSKLLGGQYLKNNVLRIVQGGKK